MQSWPRSAAIGREAGAFDPELPVAVVTAGDRKVASGLKALQSAPAKGSHRSHVEHVKGANHANLPGKASPDPVVRGVEHVLQAAQGSRETAPQAASSRP